MCVKKDMFNTVNQLLEKYIGGQIFFTELDKAVKFNPEILFELSSTAQRVMRPFKPLTIASGEIGLAMHNLGVPVDLLVPGGLRFDPSKINLAPLPIKFKGAIFFSLMIVILAVKPRQLSRKRLNNSVALGSVLMWHTMGQK